MLRLIVQICVFMFVMIFVVGGYVFLYEPEYQGTVLHQNDTPLLFAHRGFGNHAPDNSLEGARIALQAGLDGVDVDAQFSKDKEVVIFHDVSLERFTTGEGRVDGQTLIELQTYDLGLRFGDGTEFSDVYIATFEDFVKEVTPTDLLMVELKIATVNNTGMEERVVDILKQYNAFDSVYISTFNPVVLYRLKKIDKRVKTVFIFQDSGWDPERVAATNKEDRVALPWYLRTEWTRRAIRKLTTPDALSVNEFVDEAVIDRLQDNGWPLFLWPLNATSSIEWGMQKKPYGIVTDEPIRAYQIRRQQE